MEKAAAYEATSYKGLFHFVRYIERLKKYDTDFGEAAVAGEEKNMVRIMSIHKSKGLEFPVVFLAGMGKKFNQRDAYGTLLLDADMGAATDWLDLKPVSYTHLLPPSGPDDGYQRQILKDQAGSDHKASGAGIVPLYETVSWHF